MSNNGVRDDARQMAETSGEGQASQEATSPARSSIPSDGARAPVHSKSFLASVASLFSGERKLARSTVAASFVINILGLALPLVMLQVYDRILVNQSVATLGFLMIGLTTAIIAEAGLKLIRTYLMSWSATRQNFLKNKQAVTRVVYASTDRFEEEPSNIWMDRFESLDQFNAFASGQSRLIILDLPFVAIYLSVIFLVAGSLGYVLVGIIALFVALILLRAHAMRKLLEEQLTHDSRRDDFISETLQGIESVKSMAMEPQMQRRFERLQQTSSSISHRTMLLSGELQTYSQLVANIMLIAVVTSGAALAIDGALSVGTLACCTLLTSRIMQPVMRGIQVLMEVEGAKLARENAGKLSALPGTVRETSETDETGPGEIRVDKATFIFSGSEKPALDNISLHLAPGEIAGVRGEHESGKSTLIRLISGELAPTNGTCTIDGRPAHVENRPNLPANMVFVCQDSAIFEGTVMENITMFRTGPKAIQNGREAARLIALEDDIHRLPNGYDTLIGQGITDALPRGMVQRVTIARALALKPSILLFDEANSMLDLRSDTALKEGLMRLAGRVTILLISNRPSLLAIADKSYELKRGVLTELQQRAVGRPLAQKQSA